MLGKEKRQRRKQHKQKPQQHLILHHELRGGGLLFRRPRRRRPASPVRRRRRRRRRSGQADELLLRGAAVGATGAAGPAAGAASAAPAAAPAELPAATKCPVRRSFVDRGGAPPPCGGRGRRLCHFLRQGGRDGRGAVRARQVGARRREGKGSQYNILILLILISTHK